MYSIIFDCVVLYGIVLYCIILYYIVLYSIVFNFIVLYLSDCFQTSMSVWQKVPVEMERHVLTLQHRIPVSVKMASDSQTKTVVGVSCHSTIATCNIANMLSLIDRLLGRVKAKD